MEGESGSVSESNTGIKIKLFATHALPNLAHSIHRLHKSNGIKMKTTTKGCSEKKSQIIKGSYLQAVNPT